MINKHKPGEDADMSLAYRKCALIIIDGLGDQPIPELDHSTPLEAADTPVMNRMAGEGWYGLADPIQAGEIPNTHSGMGMLMGLAPEQVNRLRRGPIEASGTGRVLAVGEVAIRANFATLEDQGSGLLVTDRRAGRITSGADELAADLKDVDLGDGVSACLYSTDQHRGVLVLSGPGLSAEVSDTDPGDGHMPTPLKVCRALSPEAELTANKINLFIAEAHRRLVAHPQNIARVREGYLPANGIITRGAGAQFELSNMLHTKGVKAAMVSGCNTVLGLGRVFGFNLIEDSRFTANLETDLDAKIAAVGSATKNHDLVFLHVKAPDICAHDRQPLDKRDFLQRLDQALEPLLTAGVIVAVAADHTTNSNTGFHTADPVPTLIWLPADVQSSRKVNFGELTCKHGNMARQTSHQFLLRLLDFMS